MKFLIEAVDKIKKSSISEMKLKYCWMIRKIIDDDNFDWKFIFYQFVNIESTKSDHFTL